MRQRLSVCFSFAELKPRHAIARLLSRASRFSIFLVLNRVPIESQIVEASEDDELSGKSSGASTAEAATLPRWPLPEARHV